MNITTVAGDVAIFRGYAAGVVRCVLYSPITVTGTGSAVKAASPTFTGTPIAPTAAIGTNTTQVATTAFVRSALLNNLIVYETILTAMGSHIAGRVGGTYAIPYSNPLAISGTGTLYPIATINLAVADFASGKKLRLRFQLYTNDVAPTGNYTLGLYPITRPGTSGGTGLCIYTLGTVVSGSNGATFTAPAADLLGGTTSSEFTFPADGHYCLGVLTTATVASQSLVHIVAQLQVQL